MLQVVRTMGGRLYFVSRLRFQGSDTFVIWYGNERDGFFRAPDGRLLCAPTHEDIAATAAASGIAFDLDKVTDYDFDQLEQWCRTPRAEQVNCPVFLDAWNFFDDLAGLRDRPDTPYARLSHDAARSYDKLFWGWNLPSVTPVGEHFEPFWRPEELAEIRAVMEAGLALLAAELNPQHR